jgi:hypothetical protein
MSFIVAPVVITGLSALVLALITLPAFTQDRAFILKAMNQAVSRLYVQEETDQKAA